MSKAIGEMSAVDIEAELAWRPRAQEVMVGSLYPAINAAEIAKLRSRQQELRDKEAQCTSTRSEEV